jgi:hypothetical protein
MSKLVDSFLVMINRILNLDKVMSTGKRPQPYRQPRTELVAKNRLESSGPFTGDLHAVDVNQRRVAVRCDCDFSKDDSTFIVQLTRSL